MTHSLRQKFPGIGQGIDMNVAASWDIAIRAARGQPAMTNGYENQRQRAPVRFAGIGRGLQIESAWDHALAQAGAGL